MNSTSLLVSRHGSNGVIRVLLVTVWAALITSGLSQEEAEIPENEVQLEPLKWLLPLSENGGADYPSGLLYERWNEVGGQTVDDLLNSEAFRKTPSISGIALLAEVPSGDGKDFGVRLRGTLVAPYTGKVRFVISSDDNSELWLSANETPFARKKIAWISGPGWFGSTPLGFTGRIATQWSAPIDLEEGKHYYLEAYHKEGAGDDHFQMMWQAEGEDEPTMIPGEVLMPWTGNDLDLDDDGLPDEWQELTGLSRLENSAWWQDADGDRVTNFEEFIGSTSPVDGSAMNGFSLLEIWYGSWGREVEDLRRDPRFMKAPHRAVFVEGAATPKLGASHFGSRLSGYIVPKEDGEYELAVSGDDTVELWLSPDDSRMHKKRLAFNDYWRGSLKEDEWTKVPAQQTKAVTMKAGNAYYFEVLQKDAVEPGWSALGWRKKGEESFYPVMPEFLRSPAREAADGDQDGIPDSWASSMLSRAGDEVPDLTEFGDPDRDGLINLVEYQDGTDPLTRTSVLGSLAREWWFQVPGVSLDNARRSGTFLKRPSMFTLTAGAKAESNTVDYFASRLRGSVKAPVAGEYRFWIAGDDHCELWLSDTEKKFYKQKIAWISPASWENPDTDAWVDPQQWDQRSTQESDIILLDEGEERFLEILHKEAGDKDHVAIAWQYREIGGEWNERSLVDFDYVASYSGDDDDIDDDYLPDGWEFDVGLDPQDSGSRDSLRQGEYGDFDEDKLTNREEFLLGTNPCLADTDGDGVGDHDELKIYGSDPKVKDASPPTKHAEFDLGEYIAIGGGWAKSSTNTLFSTQRRGAVDFSFELSEAGIYLVEIAAVARGSSDYTPPISVVTYVDGVEVGSASISDEGINESWLTPWMGAGSHTITIDNRNVQSGATLEILSVNLFRHEGDDSNANSIPDWMEGLFGRLNGLDSISDESFVSPVCLEGVSRLPESVFIEVPSGKVVVNAGLSGRWYADVPLDSENDLEVLALFENGALPKRSIVKWVETNILDAPETLRVRVGASLKLAVVPPDFDRSLAFSTISIDGRSIHTGPASQFKIVTFDRAGEFELAGTSVAGGETFASAIRIEVVEADFGQTFDVASGSSRIWTPSQLPAGVDLEWDSPLMIMEVESTGSPKRSFAVSSPAGNRASPKVLARLSKGGPILGSTTINVFRIVGASESGDSRMVDILPDGTRVIEVIYLIDGHVPDDISVWIEFYVTDAVFLDGSTRYHLTADDFDENGFARVVMYKAPGEGVAYVCHWIRPYDDDSPAGARRAEDPPTEND